MFKFSTFDLEYFIFQMEYSAIKSVFQHVFFSYFCRLNDNILHWIGFACPIRSTHINFCKYVEGDNELLPERSFPLLECHSLITDALFCQSTWVTVVAQCITSPQCRAWLQRIAISLPLKGVFNRGESFCRIYNHLLKYYPINRSPPSSGTSLCGDQCAISSVILRD